VSKLQGRIIFATLLASLAAAGLHLIALQTTDTRGQQFPAPDFYIHKPVWRMFDDNGQLKRELSATRLEQWPGEPQARLTEPRLRLNDRKQQAWRARAERGWIAEDQHSLVFDKQVRLQREPVDSGPVVNTERLRITDKGDFIETSRPVVLNSGNWHFSATGLRAELGRQRLKLLGNVRGIHE
jgi:LPS export ABC transporter protein LptC